MWRREERRVLTLWIPRMPEAGLVLMLCGPPGRDDQYQESRRLIGRMIHIPSRALKSAGHRARSVAQYRTRGLIRDGGVTQPSRLSAIFAACHPRVRRNNRLYMPALSTSACLRGLRRGWAPRRRALGRAH
jgi:hypothetical protein